MHYWKQVNNIRYLYTLLSLSPTIFPQLTWEYLQCELNPWKHIMDWLISIKIIIFHCQQSIFKRHLSLNAIEKVWVISLQWMIRLTCQIMSRNDNKRELEANGLWHNFSFDRDFHSIKLILLPEHVLWHCTQLYCVRNFYRCFDI